MNSIRPLEIKLIKTKLASTVIHHLSFCWMCQCCLQQLDCADFFEFPAVKSGKSCCASYLSTHPSRFCQRSWRYSTIESFPSCRLNVQLDARSRNIAKSSTLITSSLPPVSLTDNRQRVLVEVKEPLQSPHQEHRRLLQLQKKKKNLTHFQFWRLNI